MPSPVRYMIHPGPVDSKSDGDTHYVGVRDLIRLYGVNPSECCVADDRTLRGMSRESYDAMIHLYPDYHGRYELPSKGAS